MCVCVCVCVHAHSGKSERSGPTGQVTSRSCQGHVVKVRSHQSQAPHTKSTTPTRAVHVRLSARLTSHVARHGSRGRVVAVFRREAVARHVGRPLLVEELQDGLAAAPHGRADAPARSAIAKTCVVSVRYGLREGHTALRTNPSGFAEGSCSYIIDSEWFIKAIPKDEDSEAVELFSSIAASQSTLALSC